MTSPFFTSIDWDKAPHIGEPQWLMAQRRAAISNLKEQGLPKTKTEAWRFTSLQSLLKHPLADTAQSSELEESAKKWAKTLLGDDATFQIFIVNGRPLPWTETLEGLKIDTLEHSLSDAPQSIQPYLTQFASTEYFSGLNTALFQQGIFVEVAANAKLEAPIHIVHVSTSTDKEPTAVFPRLLIHGASNSDFHLIESHLSMPDTVSTSMAVTEICLDRNSHMQHLRITEGNSSSQHLGTLAIKQERDSNLVSRSIVIGGKLSRVEIDAKLSGTGAQCNLEGVYHAVDSEQAAHHTLITHENDHGSSSQEYRGIVDDRAHAVFDGIIVVNKGTKNTSAHQQNHNLLLSEDATINTKPHLEIDSDDLSASHGATIGALDPQQLFFLRARGLSEDEAQAILTVSFVRTILDRIPYKKVLKRLVVRLIERLPHNVDIEELSQ